MVTHVRRQRDAALALRHPIVHQRSDQRERVEHREQHHQDLRIP